MKVSEQELVSITEVEHEDGELCYHFEIGKTGDKFRENCSVGPIRDPFSCIIEILYHLNYLERKDIEAYTRISCEEHKEVLDENIIMKIKEGLKLADNVRETYYKKSKK